MRGAIIGCGNYGSQLLNWIEHEPGVRMVAAYDPVEGTRDRASARHGLTACASLDAVFSERPDFVLVCSPNRHHAEACVAAAARGVHVFVEKPLATTRTHATSIVAAAQSSGVVAMVDFWQRFHPAQQELHRRIEANDFGRLLAQTLRVWRGYGLGSHPAVLRPNVSGGWAVHHAVHAIDLMTWHGGPVETVYACAAPTGAPSEEVFHAVLHFASGAKGVLEESVARMRAQQQTLTGSRAQAVLTHEAGTGASRLDVVHEAPSVAPESLPYVPATEARFAAPLRHFLACIREGRSAGDWDVATGLAALEVAWAIQASIQSGQPEAVGCVGRSR